MAGRSGTVQVRLVRDGRTVTEQDVPLAPPEGATGPLRPGQRGIWRVTGWNVSPGSYRLDASATDDEGRTWTDTKAFTVR